jgi:hypothetical protein
MESSSVILELEEETYFNGGVQVFVKILNSRENEQKVEPVWA